jgi:hypothetical protein
MLMLVTLMFGTTAANAGIIIGGRTGADTNPCEEKDGDAVKDLFESALTFAKTGIIIGGRTGIIIGGRTSSDDTCGIIIGGRTGIIIGG